jgi:hypothetical protein
LNPWPNQRHFEKYKMPIRKPSFDKIKKYIFKTFNKKIFEKMIFTFANTNAPGFSYLHLFEGEHHRGIAELLKDGPTVFDVISFAMQNDQSYLVRSKVRATLHDETRSILIEGGEVPAKPMKATAWDETEEDETEEDYRERVRQYEIEKQKWFGYKEILFFLGRNEMYHEYRFE